MTENVFSTGIIGFVSVSYSHWIILWVSYSSTNEKKHGSTEEKIAVKTKEKVT